MEEKFEQVNKPKSKKGLIIAIVILAIVVVGGAIAAYFFISSPDTEKLTPLAPTGVTSPAEKPVVEKSCLTRDEKGLTYGKDCGSYSRFEGRINYSGNEISEADINTFQVLGISDRFPVFAKDKNNVYGKGVKLEGADIDTFEVVDMGSQTLSYARDKNRMYYYDTIIQDENNVYTTTGEIIEEADTATYVMLNYSYAKDANYVFRGRDILLEQFDASTFEYLEEHIVKDKNGIYYDEVYVEGSDGSTFEILSGSRYAKDKNNVYYISWGIKIIEGADVNTFEVLTDGKAKDKNYEYRLGRRIDTSNWQTYRNDELGFEVKYPPDWKIENNTLRTKEEAEFNNPCDGPMECTTSIKPIASITWSSDFQYNTETLQSWLDKQCNEVGFERGFLKQVGSENYEAAHCQGEGIACEFGSCYNFYGINIEDNNSSEKIRAWLGVNEVFSAERDVENYKTYFPVFDQIVSTFKFIE